MECNTWAYDSQDLLKGNRYFICSILSNRQTLSENTSWIAGNPSADQKYIMMLIRKQKWKE